MSDPYGYNGSGLKHMDETVAEDKETGKWRNVAEFQFKEWYERTTNTTLTPDDDWLDTTAQKRFDIKGLNAYDSGFLRKGTIRINAGIRDKGIPRMQRTGIPTFIVVAFGLDGKLYIAPIEELVSCSQPFNGDDQTDRATLLADSHIFKEMGQMSPEDINKGWVEFKNNTRPKILK
jgi:hypothetical protein